MCLSCALTLAMVGAQGQRPAATTPPAVSIPAPRPGAPDTTTVSGGPHLVFTGLRGSTRPAIRITGWPAGLIIVGFFASIVALVWWLFRLRRRARMLKRRGKMQYRLLFEHSPCPMFAYDIGTSAILAANAAAAELLGYTDDELKQLTIRDLFWTEVAGNTMQVLRGDADARRDSALISCMCRKDGSCIDVDARGRPLEMEGGNARLVVVMDVTERLEAERALRATEARAKATYELFRSLIDVAPQPIIALDHEHRVTLWNRAAELLFGWSVQEVLGNPVPNIPPEHRASFLARKRLVDQRGIMGPNEVTRMRKDGSRIDLLAASGAVDDADGAATGYIGIFTDLTQHRILEAQLRQSQKLEAVGRLAGGIAHDFNNVLAIITSYVEMLLGPHDPETEREDLAEIGAAAARAAALTRQLLTFSRTQVVHLATVNVNDVVTNILPMLNRASAENIRLRTSLASDLGPVFADAAQLEQVILNLTVNASDAMPDGGSLLIETANMELDDRYTLSHPDVVPGRYVMLSATDTGCGMSTGVLANIFEPFFTTKEPGRGTGLGLAMAYAIVRQAGGHIAVDSEVNRGATFRIFLPRIASPLALA